jgi:hypothetical protein
LKTYTAGANKLFSDQLPRSVPLANARTISRLRVVTCNNKNYQEKW